VAPALAFFAAFVLYPIGRTAWLSLWDWNGITPATWVGLENYADAFSDPKVRSAFAHSLAFLFFYSALPIAVGLAITSVITRTRVRGQSAFRAMLFVPQILSTVVVAVAWRWIYAPDGPLNSFLEAVGLESITRAWLGDFDTALISVGFVGTWIGYGLAMVLFLAGSQKIPFDLFEAARLDGAGAWREFRAVLLPGLHREMTVVLIFTVTLALRNFDIVWNTTQGGPGSATTVPSLFIYQDAFVTRQIGDGAALSVMLTVAIVLVTGALMFWRRERDT
jgi:raffinose/stachyose/melibiose transport system permease protein